MFQGVVFRVARAHFSAPDGETFERFVVRHPGAVAVVPVADDGTVTLIRQVRAALGRPILAGRAGTCDVDDEAPEAAAHRELAEEVGLEAARLEALTTTCNSPGYSDQRTIVYLATGLSACPTGRSGVEEQWMTVEHVALDDAPALVRDGTILDETTALGLLLARAARRRSG